MVLGGRGGSLRQDLKGAGALLGCSRVLLRGLLLAAARALGQQRAWQRSRSPIQRRLDPSVENAQSQIRDIVIKCWLLHLCSLCCAVLAHSFLHNHTHADPRSICLRAPTHPSLLLSVSSDCRLRLRSLHRRRKHDPFFFGGLISFHAPVQRDRERYTAVQGEFLCQLAPQSPLHLSVDLERLLRAVPTDCSQPCARLEPGDRCVSSAAPSSQLPARRREPLSIVHRPSSPSPGSASCGETLDSCSHSRDSPSWRCTRHRIHLFPPFWRSHSYIITSTQDHKTAG